MSDLDRTWTTFAIEAEVDHHGVGRIVGAHNALRQEVERLRAEVETYARILGEGSRNGPAAAVRAVADRWATEAKLREVVEAARIAPELIRQLATHVLRNGGTLHDFNKTESKRIWELADRLSAALAAAQPEEGDHLAQCEAASRAKPEECRHEATERQGGQVVCADCFHVIAQPEEGSRG